jgi:hypothetical protein
LLRVEEYIYQRKKEDGLNEFNNSLKMENTKKVIDYVFEYFNQYLTENAIDERTVLQNEKIQKLQKQLDIYDEDVQNWLLNIYETYDKQIHRSIISLLKKEDTFFLYHSDSDFRSCSYDIYANLIKKNSFLKDHAEPLFNFIKDHHRIQSEKEDISRNPFISKEISVWVDKTWKNHKVNLWAFASDYANRFYNDPTLWPTKHKKKSKEDYQKFDYDCKQKSNLFNIDSLYTRISDKPFMKRKKQMLEVILMYVWLHSIWGDEDNYWEEYSNKVIKDEI